jgi:geranylgeranyl transferase type-2 subunit beta
MSLLTSEDENNNNNNNNNNSTIDDRERITREQKEVINRRIPELKTRKHEEFVLRESEHKDRIEYQITEHLRLSGIYWGLCTLCLLQKKDANAHKEKEEEEEDVILMRTRADEEEICEFVNECFDSKTNLFSASIKHDGHVLYTLSAIQILVLLVLKEESSASASWTSKISKVLTKERVKAICLAVRELQEEETGAFMGDRYGEIDTRFTYCALSVLQLLAHLMPIDYFDFLFNNNNNSDDDDIIISDRLKSSTLSTYTNRFDLIVKKIIDVDKACEYIMKCRNFDGGFGCTPGGESHAGQIFVCVGALQICDKLHLIEDGNDDNDPTNDLLAWWLSERQVKVGGLNGRPEKLPDVCYSWWVLSSLAALKKKHWIDLEKLKSFILRCQDNENGGISDRPDDEPDVYHTFFGIAGLSLMNHENLEQIDPIYALPVKIMRKLGIESDWY